MGNVIAIFLAGFLAGLVGGIPALYGIKFTTPGEKAATTFGVLSFIMGMFVAPSFMFGVLCGATTVIVCCWAAVGIKARIMNNRRR